MQARRATHITICRYAAAMLRGVVSVDGERLGRQWVGCRQRPICASVHPPVRLSLCLPARPPARAHARTDAHGDGAGTSLISEHALLNVPSAICTFFPDKSMPRTYVFADMCVDVCVFRRVYRHVSFFGDESMPCHVRQPLVTPPLVIRPCTPATRPRQF